LSNLQRAFCDLLSLGRSAVYGPGRQRAGRVGSGLGASLYAGHSRRIDLRHRAGLRRWVGFLVIGERLARDQIGGSGLILFGMLVSELGPLWHRRKSVALSL